MQSLQEILNQELILFRAALDTERRKRRAIQSADGKRLNELTAKSEIFMKEAAALEARRETIARSLMDRHGSADAHETLTLRRLVRIMEDAAPVESLGLKALADEFRSTVFALKRESIANNELMSNTQQRIHRLLTGITDPEADRTYTPAGSVKKDRTGKALLLNANA